MILAVALALPLAFSGCSQVSSVVSTVCTDMAALPPAAATSLNAVDPHSALGVYWADAKSACLNGVPTAGVSATWATTMWASVKALAPVVLPFLIGLL
jgi:hypothetical protein